MTTSQRHIRATARRQEVATLYLHGRYQHEIAVLLHVTQQQISKDLVVLEAAWLASSLRDFDALKATELQRVDAIERAAWEGWERSLQPREMTLTEATEGPRPGRKASLRKEGQAGDPRFLQTISKCVEQRCDILGLNAPQKIAPTSPDGTQPYAPVVGPTAEFFGALADLFQQLGPMHLAPALPDGLVVTNGHHPPSAAE